ncbi:leucine-rich repeat domain-containing protein [Streptomyces prunicolor]|uniref:leucine-rich repeat domain-containing protein n=1 Tax=Streptomyces prunicolor TaxID=67348 RepID=UPI003716CBB2
MNSSDVGSSADPSRLAGLRELLETGKPVRIRKAIGELILIRDDGSALALAARYIGTAGWSAEALIRLWPKVADPDGFCAALLAPTLVRENRTSVRLRRLTSLTGLRHLTMLRELYIERCKEITDLSEVGMLTGLTDLDLNGCSGIEDLTPLARLTELTRLGLHRCRAVEDITPLLALGTLRKLRELDLSITKVRSTDGFGTAFPALETLSLRGCRSFKSPAQLSGLTRLTHLDLGWTGIRDLTGLRDVPAMSRLDLRSCGGLRDLAGIDALPGLTELVLEDCPRLETLRGLGRHPHLERLEIKGCPELADLGALSALTRLTRLTVEGSERLTSLRGVGTLGFLEEVWLADCPALSDFSVLTRLPALRRLGLRGLNQLRDLTPFAAVPGLVSLYVIHCDGLATLEGLERQDHLTDLYVFHCRTLRHPGRLGDLPALSKVWLQDCPALTGLDGLAALPALRELRVVYCAVLADPGGLAGAPVDDLFFCRVPNLGSLRALEDCSALRRLEFIDCPRIEDLPAGSVTELQIDGVDWRDLSRLAGHKKLRVLWLDMDRLEDVSALLGMPDLIGVHVGSCGSLENLHPLPDLPLKEATYPYSLRSGRPVPRRPWSPVPSPPLAMAPRTNPSPKWSDALKLG